MKFFFFGALVPDPEGRRRVTEGDDYTLVGGTREQHERGIEFVEDVSREVEKDPPQTQGEFNMIVRDAARKVGM